MIYRRLRRFREAFASLPSHIQAAAVKAFHLFQENPNHPSLGVKKIAGRPGIWEGHVPRGYRFTFDYDTDPNTGERICIFRHIGPHNILERNP